jgi:hypothetical protein
MGIRALSFGVECIPLARIITATSYGPASTSTARPS